MLSAGDPVPHFTVIDAVGGHRVSYADRAWQRKHLVLVIAGEVVTPDGAPARELMTLAAPDVEVVITRSAPAGMATGDVVVADKWGEVAAVWPQAAAAPPLAEVAEWLEHLRSRCPECEGEAR
jgi:hypothetical protein